MSGPLDDMTLLLIASLVASRLFLSLQRGGWREHGPYVLLLVADCAALAFARSTANGVIAFTAESVGLVLSLAPWLLDAGEARLRRRDRHVGALRLAQLRELLVPGPASLRRRRELEQRVVVRSGDASRAIAALRAELRTTQDAASAARLRAELVQLLIEAGQLDDALELAEKQLGFADYHRSLELAAAVSQALSARGRLAAAVQLLVLLESQGVARLGFGRFQSLLTRTRLAFIAGAGKTAELDALLAQPSSKRELSSSEAEHLRELARAAVAPAPELAAIAEQVAHRSLELGERTSAPLRRAPATLVLIVANLAVAAAVFALGLDHDELGFARAGALYAPAVAAGEPWRLVSYSFLHAGALHLFANMYGLYFLGRAIEESLGWPRLVVIYAVASLGGSLASLWWSLGLSVGASGGILGLVGSFAVVVFARRRTFYPSTRRMLLGSVVFIVLMQAYLDWQLPFVDNAAHAGGFLVGLVATLGLHPRHEQPPLARHITIFVAAAYALLCVTTLALVLRTPLERTLLRLPTKDVTLSGVELEVPVAWQRQADVLGDPALGIELSIEKRPEGIRIESPQASDARVRPLLERISTHARSAP